MDCCNMLPIAAAHSSQNSCNCLSIFPFILSPSKKQLHKHFPEGHG